MFLVLAATAAPAALAKPRQSFSIAFTTTTPGMQAGAFLKADWFGDRPGEKPHSIIDDVFTFASGTTLDFSAVPRCRATDRQFLLRGVAACPKASRVAVGTIDLDAGKAVWHVPRIIRTRATVFVSGPGRLVTLAVTNILGLAIPVVDRATVTGTSIVTKNPATPGFPPPDPYVAVKQDRIRFLNNGFITTPPTCPDGGWIHRATFRYRKGHTERLTSVSPCTP